MKNFEDVLQAGEQQSLYSDPYLYVTPEVNNQIQTIFDEAHSTCLIGMLGANFFLAPLQTIATSLQLSVKKHKDLYEKPTSKNQLAKLNTHLTIHQKRNLELMIHAGNTKPYVAPVYSDYIQAAKGLYAQGWKAFYKGSTYRFLNISMHYFPFIFLNKRISNNELSQHPLATILQVFVGKVIYDTMMNPFYIQQNRYILQNNIPQFKVFRNPIKNFLKMVRHQQLFTGWKFHIFNNFFSFTTKLPILFHVTYNSHKQIQKYKWILYFLGQFMMYPISTAYKRLLCQTEKIPGMIPKRYDGLMHALKVILFEQKLNGLYRGFSLHFLYCGLWIHFINQMVLYQKMQVN